MCFPHGLLTNAYWDRQTTEKAHVVGLDRALTFTPQEKTDRAGRLEEDLKDAWALGVFCATGVLASAADKWAVERRSVRADVVGRLASDTPEAAEKWAEGRWTILEDVVRPGEVDPSAVGEARAADAVCTMARGLHE